jgi:hypothetical protein
MQLENEIGEQKAKGKNPKRMPFDPQITGRRRSHRRRRRRQLRIQDAEKYFGEEEKPTDEQEESNVGLVVLVALAIILITCLSYILKSMEWEQSF